MRNQVSPACAIMPDLRIVTLGTLAQQSILHPSPTGHEQSFAIYFPCALTVKISLMLDGTNSEMRYCRVDTFPPMVNETLRS